MSGEGESLVTLDEFRKVVLQTTSDDLDAFVRSMAAAGLEAGSVPRFTMNRWLEFYGHYVEAAQALRYAEASEAALRGVKTKEGKEGGTEDVH